MHDESTLNLTVSRPTIEGKASYLVRKSDDSRFANSLTMILPLPSDGRVALLGIAHRSVRTTFVQKLTNHKSSKPLPESIKTIGNWIQVKRQEKNLSSYHLAWKMGIATGLVQSWEDGTCRPDRQQSEALCKFLGCDSIDTDFFAKSD